MLKTAIKLAQWHTSRQNSTLTTFSLKWFYSNSTLLTKTTEKIDGIEIQNPIYENVFKLKFIHRIQKSIIHSQN